MSGTGPFSWSSYYKSTKNVWLSGREIGTGDNLKVNLTETGSASGGGVDTASGRFHQASRPSPKAPSGAYLRSSFTLAFAPQLDEDTNRHVEAVREAAEYGPPEIWLPWPWRESWLISTGRTQYTASVTISGSAASWPGLYYEPIVEIREVTGQLSSALTFAASSPGSTEFTLTNTTSNQTFITTGDLSASVGKVLHAWIWGIAQVQITEFEQGFVGRGEWGQSLGIITAPSPRAYEDD